MPKRSRENCGALAVAGNDDRLGSLPDDALLHVLSLLPSEDAARTCVLARRWRHLWRFTAALRIARDDDKRWSVRWLHRFVTNLLRLRDSLSPLDVCDIFCRPFVWYRGGHAAQALCFKVAEEWHLTRVELGEVELGSRILDLSDCLALEHLELISCRIQGERMLFPSVKHLRITNSSFCIIPRSSISENWGFTPVLESMPSLAKAFVQFDDECCDKCPIEIIMGIVDDKDNECVLLGGLSDTTNLELIGLPEVFVCRKDFKWSPIFRKLKTLLLNEFSLLIYFLQRSPILEKITLQLSKMPEPFVKANGCHSPREGSMVSKCLKAIEVKYQDDGVLDKVLTILNTYGVSSQVVSIQKKVSLSSE
ncbi:hypothetical protein BDA96_05G079500, partial [Sorghum bicolor]